MFGLEFHASHGDIPFTWTYSFHPELVLEVFLLLLIAVLSRALDWRSKRKLVFRKPVNTPNQMPDATNA